MVYETKADDADFKKMLPIIYLAVAMSLIAAGFTVNKLMEKHYFYMDKELVSVFNESEQRKALEALNIVRIEAKSTRKYSCNPAATVSVIGSKDGREFTIHSDDLPGKHFIYFASLPGDTCLKSFSVVKVHDGYSISSTLNKDVNNVVSLAPIRYGVAGSVTDVINSAIRITKDTLPLDKDLDKMFMLEPSLTLLNLENETAYVEQ